jgi:hypothetical protein
LNSIDLSISFIPERKINMMDDDIIAETGRTLADLQLDASKFPFYLF